MEAVLSRVRSALAQTYRVERELGRGGMATVYLAQDLKHPRQVAIKVLRPDLAAALGPERFLREITTTCQLQHPHILGLLDSGEVDGIPYYVMPFVEGESLRDRLDRERQLSVEDAVRITQEVADALDYAHGAGLIHRDIKPENILLSGGHAVVADFGIARAIEQSGGSKLTETGLAVGTPDYMSPEQAAGDAGLDGRTDQYSLGCVLYEMLAGHSPFLGKNPQEVRARHALDSVPPLRAARATVTRGIEAALHRALAKQPADRFATTGEFAAALSRTAAGSPTVVSAPASRVARRKWIFPVAAIVLLAGAAAVYWQRRPVVPVSTARVAVLPLDPSGSDSGLARLGRDLVVTLSANLDGVGDIRTVDANTILTRTAEGPLSLADAAALARRLGAGSMIHGSLVRNGTNVRVELGLFDTKDLNPLARSTVTASPDDPAVITDSLTTAVLAQIWRKGTPPSPSLAAVTTHSIPALRSFLDGERLLVEGNLDSAASAYQRAFTADTAFWLAYFRYAYVFNWTERSGADSMSEMAWQHRAALPERERLLLEIPRQKGFSATLKQSQAYVERYPDYWPGWFQLADYMVHGAATDYTLDQTIAALERTVALNPDLWWAWEHLFGVTLAYDTTKAARALAEMARLAADTLRRTRPFSVPGYRMLLRTSELSPRLDTALMDTVARSFASDSAFRTPGKDFSAEFVAYGFGRAQVEFNRRVLRSGIDRERVADVRLHTAVAWANRGAWDSVQGALNDYLAVVPRSQGAVPAYDAYRITVYGSWLGATDPSVAVSRRAGLTAAMNRYPGTLGGWEPFLRWADGIEADAERDSAALKLDREALRADTAWYAGSLARSLGAFVLGREGKNRAAADSMLALISAVAERTGACCTGHFDALNRLAASRWLLAVGDTVAAGKILGELDLVDVQMIYFGPPLYLARARINEALGRNQEARWDYAQFIRRYDQPSESNRQVVQQAREALLRLGGQLDEPAPAPH